MNWKRVKSSVEWGFFFGVVTWLFATGITNRIPTVGVWGIILSRTLAGYLLTVIVWDMPWWARSALIGGALNLVLTGFFRLPLGETFQHIGFGWLRGFWMMLITGVLFAVLNELALRRKDAELKAAQAG